MLRFRTTLLLGALVFLHLGCGPSLKEEQQAYEARRTLLHRQARRFPAFRGHIQQALNRAARTHRLAAAVRDPQKKAELVARANRQLSTALLEELDELVPQIRRLNKSTHALRRLKLAAVDRDRATSRIKSNGKVVRESYESLARADQDDAPKALRTVRAVRQKLGSAISDSESLLRTLEARERIGG